MTLNIKDKPKDGYERVVYAEEGKFNFYSVIAIHNTKEALPWVDVDISIIRILISKKRMF